MWFKVDDQFAFHPKALAAGNAALGLWVRAGSWCGNNLTDGALPANMIGTLGGQKRDAQKLVAAGLWMEVYAPSPHQPNTSGTRESHQPNMSGTQNRSDVAPTDTTACGEGRTVVSYQFTDWEQWQPTKEQVRAEREATRIRVAKWRDEQRNAVTPAVTNGVSTDAPTRPDPTRPVLPTEVPVSTAPPKSRRQPESPMPADWEPKPIHREHAKPGVDVDLEARAFRSHAESIDRRLRNWDAGFTTWLIKARPTATQPQRGPRYVGAPGQMRIEQ